MSDLISRSALKKELSKRLWFVSSPETDAQAIKDIIDNAPTVETDIEVATKDAYEHGYTDGWKERFGEPDERPQGEWGKWIITEIQCPNCFEYFETACYSTGELNKCPNCGADMRGGAENENA